jgi:rare lipoprotein A
MMRAREGGAPTRFVPIGVCAALCIVLANCSGSVDPRYGVAPSPRVVDEDQPVPKGGGVYRVGAPYVVAGRVYVPQADPHYRAVGLASWYGEDFHGRMTANGEIFDLHGITAAHPTLPLPSYVRVTNLSNGRSLIVRVNDRGPFHGNRIIDVSLQAARLLGFHANGTAWVQVDYVGPAPLEGSDDRVLAATLRQDEPAPAPGSVRLAALPIAPANTATVVRAAWNPVVSRHTHVASAAQDVPVESAPASPVAYAASPPAGMDGTEQFLNGRGLY